MIDTISRTRFEPRPANDQWHSSDVFLTEVSSQILRRQLTGVAFLRFPTSFAWTQFTPSRRHLQKTIQCVAAVTDSGMFDIRDSVCARVHGAAPRGNSTLDFHQILVALAARAREQTPPVCGAGGAQEELALSAEIPNAAFRLAALCAGLHRVHPFFLRVAASNLRHLGFDIGQLEPVALAD
jgi:hypothetical protein